MIYILVANYSFFFKSWGIIVVIYFVIVYYIHGKIIFCEEFQLTVVATRLHQTVVTLTSLESRQEDLSRFSDM